MRGDAVSDSVQLQEQVEFASIATGSAPVQIQIESQAHTVDRESVSSEANEVLAICVLVTAKLRMTFKSR